MSPVPPCPTVTAAAVLRSVPDVGSVTLVPAVTVRVVVYAPERVSEPPRVTDLPPIEETVKAPLLASVASPETALNAGSAPLPWSTRIRPAVPIVAKATLDVPSPRSTACAGVPRPVPP